MGEEKKEKKKVSASEVRKTIATSLGTAFGFVIGLLWNNVVVGGMKVGGIDPTLDTYTISKWAVFLVVALVLTVVLVVMIILISRWGD